MIVQLVQLPFSKTTKVGQFFIEKNQGVNRKIVRLVRLVRLYFTFLLTLKKKINYFMVIIYLVEIGKYLIVNLSQYMILNMLHLKMELIGFQ